MRTFDSGATRDTDDGKYDYEAFLSPVVLQQFAAYMHHHRIQPDGSLRDGDNWQKGMPVDAYMKSLLRHVMDAWLIHRTGESIRPEDGSSVDMGDALCAILFNVQGLLHAELTAVQPQQYESARRPVSFALPDDINVWTASRIDPLMKRVDL